jgi:hypothetical protein
LVLINRPGVMRNSEPNCFWREFRWGEAMLGVDLSADLPITARPQLAEISA